MASTSLCRLPTGAKLQKGGLQKQLFGLELDGNYFRFGVCHFGIKTSGNAFAELLKPLIRHWQVTHDVRIILWVDDICVICPSKCTQPDQCGGPDECVECASCLKRAQALDAQFTKDIKALGFETNRKDVPPTLSAIFLGMGFDTRTMEFWVDADKAAVFAETCALMQKSGQATRREIAKLVGKLMWWDPALFNVKLMSRALQGLIAGVKDDWQWDQGVARRPPRPMDMDDEARRFLLKTLAEPTARTVRAEASRDLCPL